MHERNPRQTPYNNYEVIIPPNPGDTPTPHHHEKFRQLVGDLGYLADVMLTDLELITGKLGGAITQLTARPWAALKYVMRYLEHTI